MPSVVVWTVLAVGLAGAAWWVRLLYDSMRCRHSRLRCIHGDEIIAANWRRARCLDCGKALAGPLPDPCHWTGRPHGL